MVIQIVLLSILGSGFGEKKRISMNWLAKRSLNMAKCISENVPKHFQIYIVINYSNHVFIIKVLYYKMHCP